MVVVLVVVVLTLEDVVDVEVGFDDVVEERVDVVDVVLVDVVAPCRLIIDINL